MNLLIAFKGLGIQPFHVCDNLDTKIPNDTI